MPIRCITFDLDDTLWDCMPVLLRAERVFYTWLSENCPRITQHYDLQSLMDHRRAWFAEFPHLHYDLTSLRKQWLRFIADQAGYRDDVLVETGFRVFWQARNQVELYDGVLTTLDRLKPRYMLGAITNGNADVHHIGIGHYFDFVVTAAGAGVAKPHPGIFTAALNEAGAPAHEVLHVGDDLERDVAGAATVGMRTLWVNPRGLSAPAACRPDGVVRSVDELIPWLEAQG